MSFSIKELLILNKGKGHFYEIYLTNSKRVTTKIAGGTTYYFVDIRGLEDKSIYLLYEDDGEVAGAHKITFKTNAGIYKVSVIIEGLSIEPNYTRVAVVGPVLTADNTIDNIDNYNLESHYLNLVIISKGTDSDDFCIGYGGEY